MRHRLEIEIPIFTEGNVRSVEPKENVDKRRVYEGKDGLIRRRFRSKMLNVDSCWMCAMLGAMFKAVFTREYQSLYQSD